MLIGFAIFILPLQFFGFIKGTFSNTFYHEAFLFRILSAISIFAPIGSMMGLAVFDKLLADLTQSQIKQIFFYLLKLKIFSMIICIFVSLLGTSNRPESPMNQLIISASEKYKLNIRKKVGREMLTRSSVHTNRPAISFDESVFSADQKTELEARVQHELAQFHFMKKITKILTDKIFMTAAFLFGFGVSANSAIITSFQQILQSQGFSTVTFLISDTNLLVSSFTYKICRFFEFLHRTHSLLFQVQFEE